MILPTLSFAGAAAAIGAAAVGALALNPIAEPAARQGAAPKIQPPPGMVLIEGGTTRIGSTVDQVNALGKQNELLFQRVVCETPQHEMRVGEFFLMVNEVTNEQFAEFVKATGRRAPEHWAEATLDEVQLEFTRAEGEAKQKAKGEGKEYEQRKFDRAEWWRRHGAGKPWQIPTGKETHPVVFVDYDDAKSYARWAGMRLPTEFEFQRAVRGSTDALYPWGADADGARCANESLRLTDTKPIGAFPTGASKAGVHDLAGNVFEWTSSPFVPYPRFKVLTFAAGATKPAREIKGEVEWDANRRVVVSGSFQTSLVVARATTRRPTDRDQATDSLGFRCAASASPGADIAMTVLNDDIPADQRPEGAQFDPARVVAADRWRTRETTTAPVPNYVVVTGYDYLAFVPAIELDVTSSKALFDKSLADGYTALGVLSTTVPVVEPALPAGSYIVGLRAASKGRVEAGAPNPDGEKKGGAKDKKGDDKKGEEKKPEADQEPNPDEKPAVVLRTPEGWRSDIDTLIFYRADGEPVSWMQAPEFEYTRPLPGAVTIGQGKHKRTETGADGKATTVEEDATLCSLKLNSLVKVSNKGFAYTLRLTFANGAISNDWRHP
jgi:formylglycine-generating enzyme required for sulfatase activity